MIGEEREIDSIRRSAESEGGDISIRGSAEAEEEASVTGPDSVGVGGAEASEKSSEFGISVGSAEKEEGDSERFGISVGSAEASEEASQVFGISAEVSEEASQVFGIGVESAEVGETESATVGVGCAETEIPETAVGSADAVSVVAAFEASVARTALSR